MCQVAFGDAVTAGSSNAFRNSSVGSPSCLVFQHSCSLCGCIYLDVFVLTCWPQTFSSFSLPAHKRMLVNIWHDGLSDNNFTKHDFCIIYFILSLEQFSFNCVATPVLLHVISQNELFHSLLIDVRVLSYQPPCHNRSHFSITFKFMGAKILLRHWQRMIISRRQIRAAQDFPKFQCE